MRFFSTILLCVINFCALVGSDLNSSSPFHVVFICPDRFWAYTAAFDILYCSRQSGHLSTDYLLFHKELRPDYLFFTRKRVLNTEFT